MAVNYGRERPTPPHVNPNAPTAANYSAGAARFHAALSRLGRSMTLLDNQVAAETGRTPRAKQNYNQR